MFGGDDNDWGFGAPRRTLGRGRARRAVPEENKDPEDYENQYEDLAEDILGQKDRDDDDEDDDSSDDDWGESRGKGGKKRLGGDDDESQQKTFMLFDFRRGRSRWPKAASLVDDTQAAAIIEKTKEQAAARAKEKKAESKQQGPELPGKESKGAGGEDMEDEDDDDEGMPEWDSGPTQSAAGVAESKGPTTTEAAEEIDENREPWYTTAPDGVEFETLQDGSTAFVIAPGMRLKLDLNDIMDGGDEKRDEREKRKERQERARARRRARWGDYYDYGYGTGSGGYSSSKYKSYYKQYVNAWTITMDIKLLDKPPADGLSLFQTALCHVEESKSGRIKMKQSDGECVVSSSGGCGINGTFGDTSKAAVSENMWHRVVVSIKCSSSQGQKGELRTWIDTEKAATVRSDTIAANERFALDPDGLFLFSSQRPSMRPGRIAVRAVRVEVGDSNDQEVRKMRARDKLLSMFNEERKAEVDKQRKGLSLKELFPKPRPIWKSPAFIGAFGDAFVEGTAYEGSSCLAWSYSVMNLALQRVLKDQADTFLPGFENSSRTVVSDVLNVLQRSTPIFKQMLRLLKNANNSQLMSTVRKLHKILDAVQTGESLLLPAIIEGSEVLLLLERTSERLYNLVVIQTNPKSGLRYHSVSASPPNLKPSSKLKYRTCMVLSGIPKKQALDDVFWMAVYNLTISSNPGDMDRFYDILLPFLTDKPLESSLVDAEEAALNTKLDDTLSGYGDWRSPQRSHTAYVRCIFEALHYLLRAHGLPMLETKMVHLAVHAQFVHMMHNDLHYVFPDASDQAVCSLALRQLAYSSVKIADILQDRNKDQADSLLESTKRIVDQIKAELEATAEDTSDLPPLLELEVGEKGSNKWTVNQTQFANSFAWSVEDNVPDPGQAVNIGKYVPINFLTVPQRATTRRQAIEALRMADQQCTLIDNQPHCVKNPKFLIFNLVEHLFTQVLPMPKPRGLSLDDAAKYRSERAQRRQEAKRKKAEEMKAKREALKKGKGKKKQKDDEKNKDPVDYVTEEPDWDVGAAALDLMCDDPCIWDDEVTYELQVEIMLTLQRLIEHFCAAAMSIWSSKTLDAVCIVVPGCACAIADAVLRRRAIDEPSAFTSHLMGQTTDGTQLGLAGFGLSLGVFATDSETMEVHYPELNVARTAVLDYFQSPQQRRLEKIFEWEKHYELRPGKGLVRFIRNICHEIALPATNPHMLLCDGLPTSSLLMKNFPEMRPYRDLAMWWKYFLNPDPKVFVNNEARGATAVQSWVRMSAQLTFQWDAQEMGYNVNAMNQSERLRCRPDPKQTDPVSGRRLREDELPKHRYPSSADPSLHVPKPAIKTEDDVIYRANLPGFGKEKGAHVLGQRDSELLISFLTVPYLRPSLCITFFASEDRVHKLQSEDLRDILDSALFEPGRCLALDLVGVEPKMVPTQHPQLLATTHGLLLNELHRSPETVVRSMMLLLEGALALDTGSVCDEGASDFNTSVDIILYVSRLACRVENYISFLVLLTTDRHDCISGPLRDLQVSKECLDKLREGWELIGGKLRNEMEALLEDYLRRLDEQTTADPKNERLIDRNSKLACDLHAHKLLLFRCCQQDMLSANIAKSLLGSFVYLTTRHTWNQKTREQGKILVAEHELYEMLQVTRRRMITWCSVQTQPVLDLVMQTALQVSASTTGSMRTSAEIVDASNRWSRIKGSHSVGRFAVASTRTVSSGEDDEENKNNNEEDDGDLPPVGGPKLIRQASTEVGEVADTAQLGVEMDLQIGQMTLRSKHLSALDTTIASHPDVQGIFGDSQLQASLIEQASNRRCYRLVGLNHEVQYWPTHHTACPPMSDEWEREYDPSELFDSERWIIQLFEPIRKTFFDGPVPPPMQFMMSEKPIADNAEVAVLLGLHQEIGGPWKLIYLFRRLRCVHVYECVSHGRQYWFSLHMTSDARYSLREMQPTTADRRSPFPSWWKRGAGGPYPAGCGTALTNDINNTIPNPQTCVVVVRDTIHELNLSGGRETLVPSRLLYGLIPEALLEEFTFWQDEAVCPLDLGGGPIPLPGFKRLRGYPKDDECEHMIIVELRNCGSWMEPTSNKERLIQLTGFPGRTVRVIRRPYAACKDQFHAKKRIAMFLEQSKLLVRERRKKTAEAEDGGPIEDKTDQVFEVGMRVEAQYEVSGDGEEEFDEEDEDGDGFNPNRVKQSKWFPCEILKVNADGTYEVEFDNYLGVQKNFDPLRLQPLGTSQRKAQGDEIWHWEGMTDSEDEDWRQLDTDEDVGNDDDEEDDSKGKILFWQFDCLGFLMEAAGGDVEACLAALERIGAVPGVQPFTDPQKLARQVRMQVSGSSSDDTTEDPEKELRLKDYYERHPKDQALLNLLYAPRGSRLYSLLRTLVRIENASYICAWTNEVPASSMDVIHGCPSIDSVELPRLKLAFQARESSGGVDRLYSMDHSDLFITNERHEMTNAMLAGIPHSLLLANSRGEVQVLVPVISPVRPRVMSEPFTTDLVLDRSNKDWMQSLSQRYFMYPVHISMSFLQTKGIHAALYLMCLRLLHRNYAQSFRLADSVATDTKLSKEGENIFQSLANANDDAHPNAHACRLKISLVTMDSHMKQPWEMTIQCAKYIVKLTHVDANCRLNVEEELQFIEDERIVIDKTSKYFNPDIHDPYSRALVHNRKHMLQASMQGLTEAKCKCPPRMTGSNWPYFEDSTVFGEDAHQAIDVNTADEFTEYLEGDTECAPKDGWLVLVAFHTLWSEECIKIMPLYKDLASAFPMVTLLTIRADTLGMAKVARKLKVVKFPTFMLFRGGKPIDEKTVKGSDRAIEKVVANLNNCITDEDKECHKAFLEKKAKEKGETDEDEEEEEYFGELQWTWDVEACGESFRIEEQGMVAALRGDEEDSNSAVWEHSQNGYQWTAFEPALQVSIETKFKRGNFYSSGSVYARGTQGSVYIYINSLKIESNALSGFNGNFEYGTYTSFQCRRKGPRTVIKGEENYLSEEQKTRDKLMQRWRDREAEIKKRMVQARQGKAELIKGASGFQRNTGEHTWKLRWGHKPASNGLCDAVGLCVEDSDNYGPAEPPLIGNAKEAGVALYCSGSAMVNGKLIWERPADSKATAEVNDGLLWTMNSVVEATFNTDAEDGVLTFTVDGEPVKGLRVTNVFTTIEASVLYPCVSLAPLDLTEEQDKLTELEKEAAAAVPDNEGGDDDEEEDDEDEDEYSEEEEDDEQKKKKQGDASDEELVKLSKMCSLPPDILADMTPEERKEIAKKYAPGAVPMVTIITKEQEEAELKAKEEAEQKAKEEAEQKAKEEAGVVESKEEGDAVAAPVPSLAAEAEQQAQMETVATLESGTTAAVPPPPPTTEEQQDAQDAAAEAEAAAVEAGATEEVGEVPIERIAWMWETKQGWDEYPPDISAKLEKAKRDGKKEMNVHYAGKVYVVQLGRADGSSEPEQVSSDGEKQRLRRHIIGEGMAGVWERMSVNYNAPLSLWGESALKILQKVWTNGETMTGRQCGLGFLFLYNLFQGSMRCNVVGSYGGYSGGYGGYSGGYGSYGGGYGGYGGRRKQSNDAHRLGLLLLQLFNDSKSRSLPGSVLNVLSRNRRLCVRFPRFRDTRKSRNVQVLNGWTDDQEPRSPLNDLFSSAVPTMQQLKKMRAFTFPPKPPHPECAAPATKMPLTTAVIDSAALVDLTDYSCNERQLREVNLTKLAMEVHHLFGQNQFKTKPPLHIDDELHFQQILDETEGLIIVDFFANWCAPCRTMTPIFRILSKQTPIARFLKVDVDECESLAEKYRVQSLPTIKFMRKDGTVLGGIDGIPSDFAEKFAKLVQDLSTPEEKAMMKSYAETQLRANVDPAMCKKLATSTTDLRSLATQPLNTLSVFLRSCKREGEGLSEELQFDISGHVASRSGVAQSMLTRMKDDVRNFAVSTNSASVLRLSHLSEQTLDSFFESGGSAVESQLEEAGKDVEALLKGLAELRDSDQKIVTELIPLLESAANYIDLQAVMVSDRPERIKFLLQREAGSRPTCWLELLFSAVLSTKGAEDLIKVNPYLPRDRVETLLQLVSVVMLRANRVGHANRCVGAAMKLSELIGKARKLSLEQRKGHASTMIPKIVQATEELASHLAAGRHFIDAKTMTYDPRFLLFEFVWNILLRQKQVTIVLDFLSNLSKDVSKVRQMIMGAGKSTVVSPLLALMLADGKTLVTSVVPKALLEMSRSLMRETFATIMTKRIYTLKFDRSTVVRPSMVTALDNAARNRGVVVTTPTALKSVMLVYVETLQRVEELKLPGAGVEREKLEDTEKQAELLNRMLRLFNEGVMLLDEVDLILHPLKSELNFPIGEKFDLDGSDPNGERWDLPTHLMDAVFVADTGKRCCVFEQRGTAADILERLSICMKKGYRERALQRLPHVTLLNPDYYHAEMKPLLAEWAFLWLQKQHLSGLDRHEAIRYILEGAVARSEAKTKSHLIDMDLQRVRIDLGEASEKPELNEGLKALMSDEEVKAETDLRLNLRRQHSDSIAMDSSVRAHLVEEEKELLVSQEAAGGHWKDMDTLYQIDEEYDAAMGRHGNVLGSVIQEIEEVTKQIEELETPHDDSLDNAVIVWLSSAFSPAFGGDEDSADADGDSSVHGMCARLEEAGWTVRRCDMSVEATERVRDLQVQGQLRAVIAGGGERGLGCGPTCTKEHASNAKCVRCGRDYNRHSGHNCRGGGRGSFLETNVNIDLEEMKVKPTPFLMGLCDTSTPFAVKHGALPAERALYFGGHANVNVMDRRVLWTRGVNVVEDSSDVMEFINDLPDWNEEVEEEEESKKEEEEEEEKSTPKDDEEDDDDDLPPLNPGLVKQESEGSRQLAELKERLEELEKKRLTLTDEGEVEQKGIRERLVKKYHELKEKIDRRRERLEGARASLQRVYEASKRALPELPFLPGPSCGRESAHALAWLNLHASEVTTSSGKLNDKQWEQVDKAFVAVGLEDKFLEQISLAAKVISKLASPLHKKLLNLTHDYLRTFMPHVLSKVNRVSFGLLSDDECNAALEEDERTPRSRLKLAVPFIGKDVPSRASEFAHPDVIIGASLLAYRYSGLRYSDFVDLIDSLTSEFVAEIGPARERPASKRHEEWVYEAGGVIRGLQQGREGEVDDSKEVVQLKFLQKSNKEQMDKLFALWKHEPRAIHYYLHKFIFPTYLRSQQVKISASGQAIGSDILVAKRVGFSGTPSDLLPVELGHCEYEVGDDGKVLSTLMNPKVVSYEDLDDKWTVELVLDRIATADNPQFHALIDTGALITGYSNLEVAQELLDRGLEWCEGVVFLDEADKKQVLVRATGRVVSADQCGVPLEKRFAFYDQIHTTGMDIKHVVNAVAVVTLGKDMVFRDYSQGAFRMRGIGAGQQIHLFIIPEVKELMQRQLKAAKLPNYVPSSRTHAQTLADVAAWLTINSMQSEQTQWTMLCIQNTSNIYRKNAWFKLRDGADASKEVRSLDFKDSLKLFSEPINFSLEAAVPDPTPFEERLRGMLDQNAGFILTKEQARTGQHVLEEVGQFSLSDGGKQMDTLQEREQEQEQEKEVKAKRDQQVEVEKFVDREYSRQEETPRPWPIQMLGMTLNQVDDGDHPFYPLSQFHLRHQEPMEYPPSVMVSRNYFNPNWTGLRRVKNTVMVLEWTPAADQLRMLDESEHAALLGELGEAQTDAIDKSYSWLGFNGFNQVDLAKAIASLTDVVPDDGLLVALFKEYSSGSPSLSKEAFKKLVTSGRLFPTHANRYWVAVSLAEAETLHRFLHMRRERTGEGLVGECEIALRYSPSPSPGAPPVGDGGVILSQSPRWHERGTGATIQEAGLAHNVWRFFDGDMHFTEPGLNALLRAIHKAAIPARQRYFSEVMGCRRRMARKWQETPLATVFTVADQWQMLKQRAHAAFIRDALEAKEVTQWEAFAAFNNEENGLLSPAELYGAFIWLDVPNLTPDDVLDFIEAADKNHDGLIDYQEYEAALKDPCKEEEEEEDGVDAVVVDEDAAAAGEGGARRAQIAKVPPYGQDVLRELISQRKRLEIERQREERLRRQAYMAALDAKIFEDELAASAMREGGANPRVEPASEAELGACIETDFGFDKNARPLRTQLVGKSSFVPITIDSAHLNLRVLKCDRGHDLNGPADYRYYSCSACKPPTLHCQYMCGMCWKFYCGKCYEGYKDGQIARRKEPKGKSTFMELANSSSFTMQIPGASMNDGDSFTVTMEVRVEQLPPSVEQLAALIKFTDDSAQPQGRARKRQKATVYYNGRGVCGSDAVLSEYATAYAAKQAEEKAAAEEKKAAAGDESKPDTPKEPVAEGEESTTEQPAAQEEKEVDKEVRLVPSKKWQLVTVVTDAKKGVRRIYIDGVFASEESNLLAKDCVAPQFIVAFGGGQQVEARGGKIRRILLHNAALDDDQVKTLAAKCRNSNPIVKRSVVKIQARVRGNIVRIAEQKRQEGLDDDGAEGDGGAEEEVEQLMKMAAKSTLASFGAAEPQSGEGSFGSFFQTLETASIGEGSTTQSFSTTATIAPMKMRTSAAEAASLFGAVKQPKKTTKKATKKKASLFAAADSDSDDDF